MLFRSAQPTFGVVPQDSSKERVEETGMESKGLDESPLAEGLLDIRNDNADPLPVEEKMELDDEDTAYIFDDDTTEAQ